MFLKEIGSLKKKYTFFKNPFPTGKNESLYFSIGNPTIYLIVGGIHKLRLQDFEDFSPPPWMPPYTNSHSKISYKSVPNMTVFCLQTN